MQEQDRTPVNAGAWRWAIIRSELTATQRHVALTIGVRMDGDGTIPRDFAVGVRRIATDGDLHRDTAARIVRELLAAGWLGTVEVAQGRRPARYRATVPASVEGRHNGRPRDPGSVGPPPTQTPVVAAQGRHKAVENPPESVDEAVDSVGTGAVASVVASVSHPVCVGPQSSLRRPSADTTSTQQYPAEPSSSPTPTSDHEPAPVSIDDLDRVTRLRYLRQARDDLAGRGYDDPALDVIHVRAQELLDNVPEARA